MSSIVDIIMWIGEESYPTVSSFIFEARKMGVSKRIPRNSIPEGIVPGRSRLLIKHRKAIVSGEGLGLLEQQLDFPSMLEIVMWLEKVYEDDPLRWYQLVAEYQLEWSPGVIGYSYITGIQYVVEKGEEELPEDLAHIKYLEPVKMEYADEAKSKS